MKSDNVDKATTLNLVDSFLYKLDTPLFAVLFHAMVVGMAALTFMVSFWAALGPLMLFLGNGVRFSLHELRAHMRKEHVLPPEELHRRLQRPAGVQFFLLALATGWGLHLGYSVHPALFCIALMGAWAITSLLILRQFIDRCVTHVP